MPLPFDLTLGQGLFLAAALFVAAFIRGLSGFGFSAIFIILAALIVNPIPLIPVVFMCEITMTLFQARGIAAHIDWRRVWVMLIGTALATVPAVAIMARLGEDQARLAISVLVLGLSLLLLSGWKLSRPVGDGGSFGAGLVAGIANSAGVGGLPTAAFLSAQTIEPAVFRATMIVFLTGIDLLALPVMGAHGLVGWGTAIGALWAFPILAAGVWVGGRMFARLPNTQFRRGVILMLTALAGLNLMRVAL